VIMDHLMSEDRTEPFQGAVFAINMLVYKAWRYLHRDESGLDEGWPASVDLKPEAPSRNQYIIG